MSIKEELEKIVNGEGIAKEKARKILNLDFTEEDVDIVTDTIVSLYQEAFDEIDLDDNDIDSLRENISEISYRNSYLLNSNENDPKRENALEQKDNFIKKIEKALRMETKGMKENEEIEINDDIVIEDDNNIYPIDNEGNIFKMEKEPKEEIEEVFPTAIDEEGNVVDLDPAFSYQPRVNKDGTLTMIRVGNNYKEDKKEEKKEEIEVVRPLSIDERVDRIKDMCNDIRKSVEEAQKRETEILQIRKQREEEHLREREELKQRQIIAIEELRQRQAIESEELDQKQKKELEGYDSELNSIGEYMDNQLSILSGNSRSM